MKNKILILMSMLMVLAMVGVVEAGSNDGWMTIVNNPENNTIRGETAVINFSTSNNVTGCALILSTTETNTSGSFDPRTFNMSGGAATLRGVVAQNVTVAPAEHHSLNFGNGGRNFTNSTFRFNSEAFLDGAYNVSVACVHVNGSRIFIPFANASVQIDNRRTPTPSDLTSGKLLRKDKTFTFVATGDTDVRSCSMSFDMGASPISPPSCSIGVNATNCSCVFTNAPFSTYRVLIDFSDGMNTTRSAVSEFTLSSSERQQGTSGGITITTLEQAQAEEQTTSTSPVGQMTSSAGSIGKTIANVIRGLIQAITGLFQ